MVAAAEDTPLLKPLPADWSQSARLDECSIARAFTDRGMRYRCARSDGGNFLDEHTLIALSASTTQRRTCCGFEHLVHALLRLRRALQVAVGVYFLCSPIEKIRWSLRAFERERRGRENKLAR